MTIHAHKHIQNCTLYAGFDTELYGLSVFQGDFDDDDATVTYYLEGFMQPHFTFPFRLHLKITYSVFYCIGSHNPNTGR